MSKKVHIESYGCQMNHSDSEIVASILAKDGYELATSPEEADLVLLNTCSIREKAEYTVMQRINEMNNLKAKNKGLKVGVLGCMAERMKENLLVEKRVVDLVVGPDAYRSLPQLLEEVGSGQKAVNVLLSREETYGEIEPVRLGSNGVTAFVTIMRGCDNMCAFCVVPFTRGRERSRDPQTIVDECKQLVANGFKEVTLLGQNVDSFKWKEKREGLDAEAQRRGEDLGEMDAEAQRRGEDLGEMDAKAQRRGEDEGEMAAEAQSIPAGSQRRGEGSVPGSDHVDFADLLEMVAIACPELRIRYSTSHPKDMTDKVLEVMARYDNICKYIHLPVQSGSSEVLKRMNRGYDREWYLNRVASIRKHMPDCAISTDIIAGFSGETEEDHQDTLSLMNDVGYDMAYMFKYSERPKTLAARKHEDDVPEDAKGRRLTEIIEAQKLNSAKRMAAYVGQVHEVLIEGVSKRSEEHMYGRNTQNSVVIVPRSSCQLSVVGCPAALGGDGTDGQSTVGSKSDLTPGQSPGQADNRQLTTKELRPGDIFKVRITSATAGSLQGEPISLITELVQQA